MIRNQGMLPCKLVKAVKVGSCTHDNPLHLGKHVMYTRSPTWALLMLSLYFPRKFEPQSFRMIHFIPSQRDRVITELILAFG